MCRPFFPFSVSETSLVFSFLEKIEKNLEKTPRKGVFKKHLCQNRKEQTRLVSENVVGFHKGIGACF